MRSKKNSPFKQLAPFIAVATVLFLLNVGVQLVTNRASKLGVPTDQNPQRHYDPNWRVTIYFRGKECNHCEQDADRLQKEEDGVNAYADDQEKDPSCKYAKMCTKTPYYVIERPGWDNEDRRAADRNDKYLTYEELKAWFDETRAKGLIPQATVKGKTAGGAVILQLRAVSQKSA